jgi:EmrB/QacA subfamily drug resistance transporter
MAFIDGSALGVALDALQKDLHASGADLLWIVNGYTLMLAALILIGGSLGDRYGRKRIFRAGILLFSLSSCVCGISPTPGLLIAARFIQGIGGALMVPGSLAIISALFDVNGRGKAIGTWSAASTVTTLIGPVLGGALANAGLWRLLFFINLPLALVALYGLTKFPETRDDQAPSQMDIPGAVLVTLGLAGLTYGAIELGKRATESNTGVALAALAVGFAALIIFVIFEARTQHPMVKLGLFRSRTFSGTNLMTAFLYSGLSASLFFLPLNLIQVQGYSAVIAGFTGLPTLILLTLLSPYMGRVVDKYGPRIPLTVGPIIAGIGFFLLALPGITNGPSDYFTTYFPGIIAIGIGMGITVAPLTTAVMGSVSSRQSGIASGINNAVARSGQALAVAILGAVALYSFGSALTARTAELQLSAENQQALTAEASNLGNAKVPASLDATAQDQVKQAIRWSFVDTYREISLIAAALAWISALVAFILIEPKLKPLEPVAATAA